MADGQGLFGLAKKVVPPQARFYTQAMLGDKTKPFTANDLTPQELQQLNTAIENSRQRLQQRIEQVKNAKTYEDLPKQGYFGEQIGKTLSKLSTSDLKDKEKIFKEIKALNIKNESDLAKGFGNVQYMDYPKGSDMPNTLGRFTYKIQPDGSIHVSDKYDFYNPFRAENVKMFEQMTPTEKVLKIAEMAIMGTDSGKNQEFKANPINEYAGYPAALTTLAGSVGEAFIGRNGTPVDIKYHPSVFQPPPKVDNFESLMYTDPFGNTIGESIR